MLKLPSALGLSSCLIFVGFVSRAAAGDPAPVVISQVYGGGGNTGAVLTHDFIEIFNRGSDFVSLSGWSLQYASATGTGNLGANSGQLTELPDVILAPGQYFLVQEGQGAGGTTALPTPDVVDTTPIAMSATAGKVALVRTTASLGCNGGSAPCGQAALDLIVDLVGYGSANFFEGSPAPAPSNSTAVVRASSGCTDTGNNAADFAVAEPAPRNSLSPLVTCDAANAPVTISCGGQLSAFEGLGASRQITATDADGTVVSIMIAEIDPLPAAGSIALEDLTPAAAPAGTASANLVADGFLPGGTYVVTLVASNDDPAPQSAECQISVVVQPVLTIEAVQGPVDDAANGLTHASPYVGQTVAVRGVIYQKTLARTASGASQYGFFLQTSAGASDGDPSTSDGIFVFQSGFADLIGGYLPQVGDEVVVSARVTEFFNLTELTGARLLNLIRSQVDLDLEVPAFEADPPDDRFEAARYWERVEGMRCRIPPGSIVIDSRDVFPSTADGEVWVARSDSLIAQAADPFARRAFRDPHPLDNQPAPLFDDGNGYRIVLGSLGLKSPAEDNTVLIAPARTYDVVTNSPVGGVYFSFSKYQVMVGEQLSLEPGVDPYTSSPPQEFDRGCEYSLAVYNVENLYDYRDDPFDGCDFAGNAGCPGVNPPFDYVPASQEAYETRLDDIANQIWTGVHAPDILLVQEAEDQDICTVVDGQLVCGAVDDADGKPDTLQELALRIAEIGGPVYQAAYDRDGADDRGIVSAFLYRADRVELLPADPNHPVLGSAPTVLYRSASLSYNSDTQNPKVLNAVLPDDVDRSTTVDGSNVFTRPPQVGLFRIWGSAVGTGKPVDLYAISNHFSSTPNLRVGQRIEQAAYNAAIVAALQAAEPGALIAVGGDLNVYPRPDDPFFPGDPLFPSDQLSALYDQGLLNLQDALLEDSPASAYSYIFQGQTQTLDQIFVTPSLHSILTSVASAHLNSDWPADHEGDGPRGVSDHDPLVARFSRDEMPPSATLRLTKTILFPPLRLMVNVKARITASDVDGRVPEVELVSITSSDPDTGWVFLDLPNDIRILDAFSFNLRAESRLFGPDRVYTITYRVTDTCGNATILTGTVRVPALFSHPFDKDLK